MGAPKKKARPAPPVFRIGARCEIIHGDSCVQAGLRPACTLIDNVINRTVHIFFPRNGAKPQRYRSCVFVSVQAFYRGLLASLKEIKTNLIPLVSGEKFSTSASFTIYESNKRFCCIMGLAFAS